MNKITVIDSLMGSGKTSWAIDYINHNTDENILYVTPYLNETMRIKESVTREIYTPVNKGNGKLNDLTNLLLMQEDIASTHALFLKLDSDCKSAIQQAEYTLFLDETIAAIEPYDLSYKNDIDYLLKKGSIEIDSDGFIRWIDEDLDTRFNPIKILAQNHSLFFVNRKLLMWRYPPEIFKIFKKVFILTYMFDASILKYYFDLNNINYETKSITRINESYQLCDYYIPDTSQYASLINIYLNKDINDNFSQKNTALSANWFKSQTNSTKTKILKNNIYNYFMNKVHAKSNNSMWTTFKNFESKLKGKGYAKGFVSCNARATNEYSHCTNLCYALNIYPHVGVSQFFAQHNIELDQDKYALSEMLQWIWRSNIRKNGKINIYIPSKRMRALLLNWLGNQTS